MEGMGLKLTQLLVRHLGSPLSMFGLMAGISWTHSYSYRGFILPLAIHPPLPPAHPLIRATHNITVVVKKVAQNPAMLAS